MVQVKDSSGNIATGYQGTIKLLCTTNCANIQGLPATVSIVNGVGTVAITDPIPETTTLGLSSPSPAITTFTSTLQISWASSATCTFA